MKGYRGTERGPDELHLTAEYAVPLFTEQLRRFLGISWNSLYLIGYAGTGNVADTDAAYTRLKDYRVDVGFGLESAFSCREYRVLGRLGR